MDWHIEDMELDDILRDYKDGLIETGVVQAEITARIMDAYKDGHSKSFSQGYHVGQAHTQAEYTAKGIWGCKECQAKIFKATADLTQAINTLGPIHK